MPKVHFTSTGRAVEVEPGTDLMAAASAAGLTVRAECGGKGTCKSCMVVVESGTVDPGGGLPAEVMEEGFVLACLAKAGEEDCWVRIPGQAEEDEGASVSCAQGEGEPSTGPGAGEGADQAPDPLAGTARLEVDAPAEGDGLSDVDRLLGALDMGRAHVEISALREMAGALRAESGRVEADWALSEGRPHVLALRPGHHGRSPLGAAVDLGTTSISLSLVELDTGREAARASCYNGQLACGLDVISRINYAQRKGGLDELARLAAGSLNGLLDAACDKAGRDPGEVLAVSAAGNTVMAHLLLGLDPEHLRLAPYVPTVMEPEGIPASHAGIRVRPGAPLVLAPAVGSYVGGDITAGLSRTTIPDKEGVGLYIDIGTNGEVALGNSDFLMACACSAGPAFEGGGVSCGMRAARGAVERARIDPETGEPSLEVIGAGPPRGVCGSGIISLVSGLFASGWLDAGGRLVRDRECSRIRVSGRRAEYVLSPDGEGPEVTVTEADIDAVVRAKAAIFAGCRHLLSQVGLDFPDLDRVVVAGGFGHCLDIEAAVAMGLLPDVDRDRFSFVGNASLAGAVRALTHKGEIDRRRKLASRMTYVDLSSDTGYMDQYTAALFLPHTEAGLFPSASGRAPF